MPLRENEYKKKRPENYRGSGWIASRPRAEAHRGEQARGLSAAAADDFCDCPERAYLGTGWVEETEDGGRRDSSSVSN